MSTTKLEMKTVRRWNAYPAYCSTEATWFPIIPRNWQVMRLKHLTSSPFQYGANESGGDIDRTQVRFVRITDIDERGQLREETFCTLPRGLAQPYLLCKGDILFARSGATVGKTFLYRESWGEACYAGYLIRYRPRLDRVLPEFVAYFTATEQYRGWVAQQQLQATIQNVSAEKFANLLLPLPPTQEQGAIVAFLDREMARIDKSIGHKERLITLLEEKRQAVISHAVTRGLDPAAPLKESGIPWLGMVPKHWTIGRLRHRMTKIEQGWSPQCDNRIVEPGEWGVLKVGCMNSGIFDESECKALPADLAPLPEFEIRVGDVLMSRSNTVELVGMTGIVHQTQGRILPCDKLYRLAFRRDQLNPEFAVFLLRSSTSRSQIEPAASGASSSMRNISAAIVRDLVFAFPPMDDQSAIAARVKDVWGRIDRSQSRIRDSIAHLREYRAALISAAVTGQIDVRGEV